MANERCDLLCLDLPHAEEVRALLPPGEVVQRAAERARGLADPTRLRLALALAAGDELCVCDLAWVSGLAQNLVSHHVRQLRAARLAESRRDGKLVMYRLTPAGRTLLAAMIAASAPRPAPDAPTAAVRGPNPLRGGRNG